MTKIPEEKNEKRKIDMQHYLVVGGTKGIGRSLVNQLIAQGQSVTVWARQAAIIPGVQVWENDPALEKPSIADLPEQLDGLVYCPGTLTLKPFARITPEEFINDFQVNLLGAVRSLQAVAPLLSKSDQASVVLFSSVAATLGMPYHSSIASSKAAVEGLVKSLAAEWAPKIRVNGVAPSLTNTPLAEKLVNTPEKREVASKRHPLQKIGSSDDLASMVSFLLSAQSSWITGQIFHVDGGMSSLKI